MTKVRSHKAKKSPEHEPRPANSFILYRSAMFKRFQEEGMSPETTQGQLSKLIGQMWHEASPEVHAEYKALYEETLLEHARKYPNYVYTPMSKEEKRRKKAEAARKKMERESQAGKRAHRPCRTDFVPELTSSATSSESNSAVTTPTSYQPFPPPLNERPLHSSGRSASSVPSNVFGWKGETDVDLHVTGTSLPKPASKIAPVPYYDHFWSDLGVEGIDFGSLQGSQPLQTGSQCSTGPTELDVGFGTNIISDPSSSLYVVGSQFHRRAVHETPDLSLLSTQPLSGYASSATFYPPAPQTSQLQLPPSLDTNGGYATYNSDDSIASPVPVAPYQRPDFSLSSFLHSDTGGVSQDLTYQTGDMLSPSSYPPFFTASGPIPDTTDFGLLLDSQATSYEAGPLSTPQDYTYQAGSSSSYSLQYGPSNPGGGNGFEFSPYDASNSASPVGSAWYDPQSTNHHYA